MNIAGAWKILRNAHRGDIGLLYSIDEFSLLIVWACHVKHIPCIIQMSLIGADDPGSFEISRLSVLTRLKLSAFKAADRVIGLSTALTESCAAAGISNDRIVRIPNGVDTTRFSFTPQETDAIRQKLKLNNQRKYVCFVGSALHRKGIDVVVSAFIEVAGQMSVTWSCLIVGNYEFQDHTRNDQSRRDLVIALQAEAKQAEIRRSHSLVGAGRQRPMNI